MLRRTAWPLSWLRCWRRHWVNSPGLVLTQALDIVVFKKLSQNIRRVTVVLLPIRTSDLGNPQNESEWQPSWLPISSVWGWGLDWYWLAVWDQEFGDLTYGGGLQEGIRKSPAHPRPSQLSQNTDDQCKNASFTGWLWSTSSIPQAWGMSDRRAQRRKA